MSLTNRFVAVYGDCLSITVRLGGHLIDVYDSIAPVLALIYRSSIIQWSVHAITSGQCLAIGSYSHRSYYAWLSDRIDTPIRAKTVGDTN